MDIPCIFSHLLRLCTILIAVLSLLTMPVSCSFFRSKYHSGDYPNSESLSPDIHTEKFSAAAEFMRNFRADTDTRSRIAQKQPLVVTFAGDLMAHTVNFNMDNYAAIYTGVQDILLSDDISFVNVETPVCDALPLSSYPSFNVHTAYLRAAFTGGFDVFSFANNHTNDKNVRGINGTLAAVQTLQAEQQAYREHEQSALTEKRPLLAYSGLKTRMQESFAVTKIPYKNWNILFCAVTELLNSYDSSKERLYYSPPTAEGRKALCTFIEDARKRNPCDLFILSLHLNEPEYVRTVSAEKKEWFKQLGESGVDIIWAHHPHVMQEWETITVERPPVLSATAAVPEYGGKSDPVQSTAASVFCMYSMGNFISGQRWQVHYENPAYYREYTGDAVMLQAECRVSNKGVSFSISPILITQYNNPCPVVRVFTPEWIESLEEKEKEYFKKRFNLMHEYLPLKQPAIGEQCMRRYGFLRSPVPLKI